MRPLGTSRKLALLTPVLGLALLSPVPPAEAANVTVVVANDMFSPGTVTRTLGGTVTWSFRATHTSTSDQGFWNSGDKNAGQSFVRAFSDSGTYPYHCTIHPMMHGKVRVPLKFAGTAAHGYALRWSSRTSTPSTIKFDIQFKRVGTTTWSGWRTATASRTGTFNPAGAHSYYLRARTHLGSAVSSWSPVVTLKLT